MATRTLAVALAALALAPPALAQTVPPRQFVGPPAELAGSAGSADTAPATPTIPGGMVPLPKSTFVGPPKPEPPVFGDDAKGAISMAKDLNSKVGSTAGMANKAAEAYHDAASAADAVNPNKLPLSGGVPRDVTLAGKIADGAKTVGAVTKVVSVGTNTLDMTAKCTDPKVSQADCAKASLTTAGSYASAVELVTEAPGAGQLAKGFSTAADTVAAYDKCSDPKYSKLDCGYATVKVVADVAGFIPGPATTLSTTWALSTAGGEFINSLAPNASMKLYDLIYADENIIKDATPAQLEQLRERRHAAYERQKGALMSKQEAYDAEEARKQAQALAAAQRGGDSSGGVNFLNAFLAGLPGPGAAPLSQGIPVIQTSSCPGIWMACANNGKTWAGYEHLDSTASRYTPSPAPVPKPPASSGCHLTDADLADHHVCTSN